MVNFQIISLCEFFFFFKHKTAYELRISDWSSDVCSSYLKLWQDFHVADNAAPYLSKAFVDSRFDFTRALSGVSEQRPRWKRGLTLVDGSLGELVGREHAAQYFPPSAQAQMVELVAILKLAMVDRIRTNSMMATAKNE